MSNHIDHQARCIAVLGTGSDVGKSIITTALCRILKNRGISVAPFKAQNMSNNSGVTPEGLEMGRAQIVQAEAAKIPPHVDMNPILLKPTTDVGAQVVLLGKAVENCSAMDYHRKKEQYVSIAYDALNRLRRQFDRIIIEGAGSCAEVNLMSHDIVNFRVAEYADAPVVLVADIHRGGVFAQIVGTLECLDKKYQDRICGAIINRFRGDIRLFQDGVRWLENKTRKKIFGVLPWFSHFKIEAEDSVVIENPNRIYSIDSPTIAVIRLPHISNFTDIQPLSNLKGLQTVFIESVQDISDFKAIILPGSKNTRFDLNWLKQTGWADKIQEYARKGGCILGICGGYQMLGKTVHDPDGLEGIPGSTDGLGLLPVETIMKAPKTTTLTRFKWDNVLGMGYEIHMGQTVLLGNSPLLTIIEQNGESCHKQDGCISPNQRIIGTYMHGFFDSPEITSKWLSLIGLTGIEVSTVHGPAARDASYDLLAKHVETYVDVEAILSIS